MQEVITQGAMNGGKLSLLDRSSFANQLSVVFGKDCLVDVCVIRKGKTRTSRQNNYLWGVPYKLLSDHLGYPPEEIHEICKYKFLSKHYDIGDESLDVGASTAKLTTAEFEDYAENIRRWGATLGANIPLPNEAEYDENNA
jgi:hypothetical protein